MLEKDKNNKVLVHCAAGVSRSGAIVLAYIMYKEKLSFEDAWEYAKQNRRKIYPNLSF